MANAQYDIGSSEYMTLSDIMKAKLGSNAPLTILMDEYKKSLTLGADIPACEASDKFEDRGVFMEPWEYDKFSDSTDLDGGSRYYKTGTYARKDIMGMRSSAIGINERQYLASGADGNLWRAQQTFTRVKHIGLDREHDMVWGDPTVDPNLGLGLAPRFNVVTDMDGKILAGTNAGQLSPYITLSAGGTTSGSLGSVYLIHLSSTDGVCWIYPKDSSYTAGVRYVQGQFQDVMYQDASGNTLVKRQASDIFEVVGGLAMKSRRSAIRIANIDFSTDDGIKAFDKKLYEAFESMPTEFQSSTLIYAPKSAIPSLKMYYRDKFYPTTYDATKPVNLIGDFAMGGFTFRRLEQLNLKESKIV